MAIEVICEALLFGGEYVRPKALSAGGCVYCWNGHKWEPMFWATRRDFGRWVTQYDPDRKVIYGKLRIKV